MTILLDYSPADEAAYLAMLAERDEPGQAVAELPPVDALEEPAADEDMGDWWNWMGPDPDIDARWCLTFAGGAGSVPDPRCRSTRKAIFMRRRSLRRWRSTSAAWGRWSGLRKPEESGFRAGAGRGACFGAGASRPQRSQQRQ